MHTTHPITTLINQRFSCRKYLPHPIEADQQRRLKAEIAQISIGPFGNQARFELVATTEKDMRALHSLGTYGFIRKPAGFIIGATKRGEKYLEDFGYLLEILVLRATDLGLGTCWLGGTFTQGSFSRKIAISEEEIVPAVVSVGVIPDETSSRNSGLRRHLCAHARRPWSELFFSGDFDHPLAAEEAGRFATPLEMARLAPSASNKQPWRILLKDEGWHFYLSRTPGYREGLASRLRRVVDLQRLDMGIAMCHFELTAHELDLPGAWKLGDPGLERLNKLTEYVATWVQAEK